ncbi:integrase catalytic subunit [Mycobacterium sp. MOTT36Y]|nr:integrase catalytic subunit [Mycobacterium sp. MOTT36Y]
MPAGKRLAPMLAELVAVLRHFRELVISDETAALLVSMSAATIDRRLADERAKYTIKGRVGTKPGSLLKSQIPVRTWAEWDDAVPGFVEIDTVFHDGGNRGGGHAFTLTVTDIATGWTESRSLPDRAAKHVLAALNHIAAAMPFPIVGVDCDNGSEFINDDLLTWCQKPLHHFHPVTTGQQERRLPRRAEKLGSGTHSGRLLPLRHRIRTVATQRNLASADEADQLLPPPAETDLQSPHRSQGVPQTRQGPDPVSPRDQSPEHGCGTHCRAQADPLADQSGRHPTPDSGVDRPALHPGHQQSPSRHPRSHHQARTLT